MSKRPERVAPAARQVLAGQQTAAMTREQAFAGEDRWVGIVRADPGEWSGWHHHGETDTYFYVLKGSIELDVGGGEARLAAGPGDFAHVPSRLVHRERTAPGEPGEIVLVRFGLGPAVVNVDGPEG